jgi:hypothetical protein
MAQEIHERLKGLFKGGLQKERERVDTTEKVPPFFLRGWGTQHALLLGCCG